MLKRKAAALSSEIIQKQKEVFTVESSKNTFVLRTKDVKFDCELLGKFQMSSRTVMKLLCYEI